MGGVMKSWAIPKGPSLNPTDKRLAVMVEDHPYDYRTFEGVIPAGNYGAGNVEIWDKGTYTAVDGNSASEEKALLKALKQGSLKFTLNGTYLKGEFALVKMKSAKEGNAWLLIKHRDEFAVDDTYSSEDHASLTALAGKATVKSKRRKSPPSPKRSRAKRYSDAAELQRSTRSSKRRALKKYIQPMLARSVDKPFDDEHWLFEIKWDGYRAIAELGRELKLYSRNGLSFSDQFPEIVHALKEIKARLILDGEIVALDESGRARFQHLQDFDAAESTLAYYVFDILKKDMRDTTSLPLLERKEILKSALPVSDVIRYSDHIIADGKAFFEAAKKMDIEGVIAKEINSHYESGQRTGNWLKIKNTLGQEAVIAGFTAPRGSRKFFGSLLLGINDRGSLRYAGHAGTGFSDRALEELHQLMTPLITDECPFEQTPKTNTAATWIKPELVCNVEYSEMTKDGVMRHPVFKGLRIDKASSDVIRENTHMVKAKRTSSSKTARRSTRSAKSPKRSTPVSATDKKDSLKLNGQTVPLTHQDKIYFPEDNFTKGDIVDYYQDIASYILPYLKNRPQSLFRTPNGIHESGFFHKDAGDTAPDWVKSTNIYSDSAEKDIDYIICNNKATLAYLNNLGCIELNPWHSRLSSLDKPDYFAIDIDPSSANTFDEVIETARAVKEVFDRAGTVCYCKTSGATGLHVYAALGARYDYETVKKFAEIIALMAHELVPDTTSLVRPLKQRGKKIYIDFLQNRRGQTLASVYSARPVDGANVSTPLEWKEVRKGLHPSRFTIKNIGTRLQKKGDLFRGVLGKGLDMEKCLEQLGVSR
jgi:bifunctional non-homologous end joining protein LigD